MTLEDAIAVLNANTHNGHRWIIETTWDGAARYAECGGDHFEDRSEFEAIAIAEAYLKKAREKADHALRHPLD